MSQQRPGRTAVVVRTRWLSPRMVRVVLGGQDLLGFDPAEFSDSYVKLLFPQPGTDRPARRTYTVRRWDPAAGELTIDFVYHGDSGLAGPWAAAARPGDQITVSGPGGQYTPSPTVDWHLMVGDASALPAIVASLQRVPAGRQVRVFLEVDGEAEVQRLDSPGLLTAVWLDSSTGSSERLLADAVRGAQLPAGQVGAFVHGEAGAVQAVRRHLLSERGVARGDLSVSGYWKRGRTEEGWREDKADWQRQAVAADEQHARAS